MEFGIFCHTPVFQQISSTDPEAEHRLLMQDANMAVACEGFGYKYVWASEHHFLHEYSHLSSPEVFLTHVAARTQRIHVGSGITNITPPVNHPARVAERVALMDHLTGGRFEFGTGRGSSTTEQLGFGIETSDITRDMWDEAIREIPRMWKEDNYQYEGRFFSMPPRNVLPKPLSRPHPPIWVACGNPATFEKAGRLGLGALCFSTSSPTELEPLVESYKRGIAIAEPVGAYVNDNIMVSTGLLCLEDRQEAFRRFASMGTYLQGLLYRYLDTFPRPSWVPAWPTLPPAPSVEVVESRSLEGSLAVGNPEDCLRVMQEYKRIGVDQVTFGVGGVLPEQLQLESLELFGQTVVPPLDTDPEHRTTAQRIAAGLVADSTL